MLVSRKWSNKTLDNHHAERAAFVRQLLIKAGVQPAYAIDDGPFAWEKTRPRRPRRPQPAGPAAARDQSAPALESRLPRRAARGRRTSRKPFGNRGGSGVSGGGGGRLLSVGEAAEVMATPERFVRRLIAERCIAYHKIGKYVRLAEADVLAFVQAGRVEPVRVQWHGGRVVA